MHFGLISDQYGQVKKKFMPSICFSDNLPALIRVFHRAAPTFYNSHDDPRSASASMALKILHSKKAVGLT